MNLPTFNCQSAALCQETSSRVARSRCVNPLYWGEADDCGASIAASSSSECYGGETDTHHVPMVSMRPLWQSAGGESDPAWVAFCCVKG
jgi:hypothetical protein